MAITHKQLVEVFGFQTVKNSAYGIRSYKKFKSGIELFAKKNSIEVIVPGLPIENYSLEHMSIKELQEKLPKIIASVKKKEKTAPVDAKDLFIHKVFINEMELLPYNDPYAPGELLSDKYGKES